MNPKDRDQNSSTDRRDQDSDSNKPLQGAPGGYGDTSNTPGTPKGSGSDAADGTFSDDEDSDQGEAEERKAGGSNPGQRRESPDDAMRRERSQQEPPKSGGPQRPGGQNTN